MIYNVPCLIAVRHDGGDAVIADVSGSAMPQETDNKYPQLIVYYDVDPQFSSPLLIADPSG